MSKPGENVDVHVRSFDVLRIKKTLENMGINYTVMIENLQSVLKQEQESMAPNNGYFSRFNYEKYNPYSAVGIILTETCMIVKFKSNLIDECCS